MAVVVRSKVRPRREIETRPAPAKARRRYAEAPDQGDLDPRRLEVIATREDRPREAPDAGEAESDWDDRQS
jgi:hypothetical protein